MPLAHVVPLRVAATETVAFDEAFERRETRFAKGTLRHYQHMEGCSIVG
jgi:hypothetical protein